MDDIWRARFDDTDSESEREVGLVGVWTEAKEEDCKKLGIKIDCRERRFLVILSSR